MDINYLAVLIAALSSMVIGSLWYGPLFGKQWQELSGMSRKDKKASKKHMTRSYIFMFIGSLLMSWVLAPFIIGWADSTPELSSLNIGLQTGFWLWLGIVAPILLGSVLWENKPVKLYILNIGYWFATLLTMGAILGYWR